MVIYIEGQDCTGKSSTIETLLGAFSKIDPKEKFNIHHFDKPLGRNNEQRFGYQYGQFSLMFDFINKGSDNWIFDRSHIGEYVYGPMWRKKDPKYLTDLESDFLSKYNDTAITVYLDCENDEIQKRFNTTRLDEECPSVEDLNNNRKLFKAALEKSVIPSIIIDTTNTPTDQVCKQIVDFCCKVEQELLNNKKETE